MGIRGIDIQVAIQRAAEADKVHQTDTAQGRASDAAAREAANKERLRKQAQSQQTAKSDQAVIQQRKEKEGREDPEPDEEETVETFSEEDFDGPLSEYDTQNKAVEKSKQEERPDRRRKTGHLDILA